MKKFILCLYAIFLNIMFLSINIVSRESDIDNILTFKYLYLEHFKMFGKNFNKARLSYADFDDGQNKFFGSLQSFINVLNDKDFSSFSTERQYLDIKEFLDSNSEKLTDRQVRDVIERIFGKD